MATSFRRMNRNAQRNLPTVGGGGVGVAAPAALREFADVQNGQPFSILGQPDSVVGRLTRPSVAWGLGAGTLTGALYMLDAGPSWLQEFALAHTLTAVPVGAASAALPVEGGLPSIGGNTASVGGQRQRALSDRRRSSSPSSNGSGDFQPADGQSADTQPAN